MTKADLDGPGSGRVQPGMGTRVMPDGGAGEPAQAVQRLFVQYGCGLAAPDGWINFDASPRLRFERLPGAGAGVRLDFVPAP